MWRIPYRDLRVQDPVLKSKLLSAVNRVFDHGQFLMGNEVEQFEKKIADYCDKEYCVGVSSGTNALYLALRCIGVGPGDEVILPPHSWIATLNAVYLCGAKPVFVDIKEDQNINFELIEKSISSRTKVILPVHFTGTLCEIEKISALAKSRKITVIEDAAQAFGARRNNIVAGGFGDFGCFSMNPMKVLPSYGEAGAIVTNNREHYERLVALRYLGTVNKEECYWPSLNSKIDSLQAAFLQVSLEYIDSIIGRRIEIAKIYSSHLTKEVKVPLVHPTTESDRPSTFFSYTILSDRRDHLKKYLEECGIEVKIHHPILMPDQPAYKSFEAGDIPVARKIVKQILSLPIHEKMTDTQVYEVIDSVQRFFSK